MRKRLRILLLAVVVCAMLAGCGGPGSTDAEAGVGQETESSAEETTLDAQETEPLQTETDAADPGKAEAGKTADVADAEKAEAGENAEEAETELSEEDLLYTNTISEEVKELAQKFPAVDGDLPEWRGTHIVNKAEFAWPWVIVETEPEKVTPEHLRYTDYDRDTVLEIAEAGYNYVRVSIDTRFFFTKEEDLRLENAGEGFCGDIDTVNLAQYENLDRLIEWCIQNDLHVCLDVHSTPGGLMIGGDEEASRKELFTPDSGAQNIFTRFWSIIAKRYADIDTRALSFDLYNEPPTFAAEAEDIYIALMNTAIAEIQKCTPDRLIIVDALDYSTKGLDDIEALTADNLVIGFHLYANESTWTEPGAVLDLDACKTEIADRIAGYDEWARANNVRWILHEYGCATYIPEDQQEAYYGMVIDSCKSIGVPYCLWAFNAGDFGICIWADDDKFVTPGAVYDKTGAGHRINTKLAEITTE